MIARKDSSTYRVKYEGTIIKMKDDDLIVVQFGDDFVKTFNHFEYNVDFSVSRSTVTRQHFAIDLAIELFGNEFLMPIDVILRKKDLISLNGWFNDNLNIHQKQAVKQVLRCNFSNPYIIFGPPGKHFCVFFSSFIFLLFFSQIRIIKIQFHLVNKEREKRQHSKKSFFKY